MKTVIYFDPDYFYNNDNEFKYNGVWYYRTGNTRYCYKIEYSAHSGKIVKRHISSMHYDVLLKDLKSKIATEAELKELGDKIQELIAD